MMTKIFSIFVLVLLALEQASGEGEEAKAPLLDSVQQFYEQSSCGSRNLGGFVPEDVSSPEYQTYAALALSEYIKNSAESQLKECQPNYGAAKQSISVVAACKQVVAGTNYSILFNVKFPCRNETFNAERAVVQKLAAVIYVPLPSSNTEPRVISVKQV